jgi:hypothetical protein
VTALPRHRKIVLMAVHVGGRRDDGEGVRHGLTLYRGVGRCIIGIGDPKRPQGEVGHGCRRPHGQAATGSRFVDLWLVTRYNDV